MRISLLIAVLLCFSSCGERSTRPDNPSHIWPLPPPDSLLVVEDWQPACSPDGRLVAYSHEVKPGHESELGTFGIYTVEVGPDSVGAPTLVVHISGARWLNFAADSRRIAYGWNGNIWVADVTNGENHRLTTHSNGQKPNWNPRGDAIVYNRMFATDSLADSGAVRIIDVATLKDAPVHKRSGGVLYGGGPAWDPAGESIVYTHYVRATRGLEVFRVYPGASEEIQLTSLGWGCELPKWIDHGRSIVVRISPGGIRDPDFPDWWVISLAGDDARPFYDMENQVEVGSNMGVGPAAGEFVLTRPAAGNEHWLALWIARFGDGDSASWRQITGPR